jgi:hypothetical protein
MDFLSVCAFVSKENDDDVRVRPQPHPTPPHHESVHACLPPARITAGTLDWCRSALHSATQLSDNLVRWPHHQPKMIVQVLLNDASQSLVVYENNARSSPSLSLLFSFLCFLEKNRKDQKYSIYHIFECGDNSSSHPILFNGPTTMIFVVTHRGGATPENLSRTMMVHPHSHGTIHRNGPPLHSLCSEIL